MKKLLFLIFILVLVGMLFACELDIVRAEPIIKKLYVDGIDEYYYSTGEELILDGAKLFVQYENDEVEILDLDKSMIDENFSNRISGVVEVVVNYKGASTFFVIEIIDSPIEKVELKTLPDKTTYIEGTSFDVRGATIDVLYENGIIVNVQVLKNNIKSYDANIIGNQMVKVSYRGRILNIPIEIVPKTLQSISVKTLPTNASVFLGQRMLDPTGMVLNFVYDNNTEELRNISSLANVEYSFDSERETPSTEVVLKYTLYTDVNVYKEFFTAFRIRVRKVEWKSMRVVQYPMTRGVLLTDAKYDEYGNMISAEVRTPSTDISNIIEGDIMDLSTGKVEVTFSDDSKEIYKMNDPFVKLYNEQTIEKAEILGLSIVSPDKRDVPTGNCRIDYRLNILEADYIYDSRPTVAITAKNQDGVAVSVKKGEDYSYIEAFEGQIYYVTIKATVIERKEDSQGVEQDFVRVTAQTFKIVTLGAVEPRQILNISSAGRYKLSIIFKENTSWSTTMDVNVVGKEPQIVELSNTADALQKEYVVGDIIDISTIKYRIKYNNGDTDPWSPVTAGMLVDGLDSLRCDYATDNFQRKSIAFEIFGLISANLSFNVVPLRAMYLEIEPPINTYVIEGGSINPQGALLTAYLNNNTKQVLDLNLLVEDIQSPAYIINDPLSIENTKVNFSDSGLVGEAYNATVFYMNSTIEFEYFVVDREVESLRLVREGNVKTDYYENEELNLDGLKVVVKWKNSMREDTIAVTKEMLYKYDKNLTGPQTLRIRYRGVLNESFSIYVTPRVINEIRITRQPKTTYIYGVDMALDVVDIRVSRHFNDGISDEQLGIRLGLDEQGFGWTYNVGEIDFRRLGNQQVVLWFYDKYHIDEPLSITYKIEVKEDGVKAIYLSYPPSSELEVVASVPRGMELNLYDAITENGKIVLYPKVIFVEFYFSLTIREIPLTADMFQYDKANTTVEDRVVVITYNGAQCNGIVRVLDWGLMSISVEKNPKTKYMIGEELDLAQGIIKRSFLDSNNQQHFDYMPMFVDGIEVKGFDSSLQESDYAPEVQYKDRPITLSYGRFQCTFSVRIYKKFNAEVSYFSTVSFYGDVSLPHIEVRENEAEFALPRTNTYFINSIDIQMNLLGEVVEEIEYDSLGNVVGIKYRTGDDYYLRVLLENGTQGYICQNKIKTFNNYPTSPAQEGNQYLILVQVQGNKYYNHLNYATKEFRIINKYINVNAVVPNEKAIVWEYTTSNNARAVYLLGEFIENLMVNDSSYNIILASPTYESFEIIIVSYGNNNLNMLKDQIEATITSTWWSYVEVVRVGGLPLLDDFGNEITKIIEKKVIESPTENAVRLKVDIRSHRERIGVNYKVFGSEEEILSYYVPMGGLIAVRNEQNFFVMELFSGKLFRKQEDRFDVMYEAYGELVNGFDIEDNDLMQVETIVKGYEIFMDGQENSLHNPNYFLNFQRQRYIIAPQKIVDVEFMNAIYDENLGALLYNTNYDDSTKILSVRYRLQENAQQINLDNSQLRYYYIDGGEEIPLLEGEFPKEKGLYRGRITHNYKIKEGYEQIVVWECYLRIN